MLEIIGDKQLYQWDTGKTANVTVDCNEVHFSNLKFGKAFVVDVIDKTVAIPDEVLMSGEVVYAWAFVRTAENGHTKQEQTLPVTKRAKPNDYAYAPTDIITLKELALKDKQIESDIEKLRADVDDKQAEIDGLYDKGADLQSQIDTINTRLDSIGIAEEGAY